jgi:phage terminase small subunit
MQMASTKIEPTSELDERELTHFKMITSSRETESWMDNHRHLATNLAKTYVQIEDLDARIKISGAMIPGANGIDKMNPAVTAKTNLNAIIINLNRALGLMAVQNGLSGKAQNKRNQADQSARKVIERAAQDDLI